MKKKCSVVNYNIICKSCILSISVHPAVNTNKNHNILLHLNISGFNSKQETLGVVTIAMTCPTFASL